MYLHALIGKLKNNRYVSEYMSYKALKQLLRYLIVGFSTVGLEFVNLRLFTEYIGLWYLASNTIAYIISFVFNFFLNRFWSFKSSGNIKRQLLIYGVLFIINLALSNLVMYLLTDILGIMYMISKIFSVGLVVSWNFIIYKKIIFTESNSSSEAQAK
jgi:putative flippase GtrA